MLRRDLFKLAALGALTAKAGTPLAPAPKRLIVVYQTGGWDTTYALDPKEPTHADVPAGSVAVIDGLDVFVDPSRPNVTDFFTRYAANTTLVRGIAVEAINHMECIRRMATGTREETKPDLGAIVAHDLANDLPLPYLILGSYAFTGPYASSSSRLGQTNQLASLVAPPVSDSEAALLRAYAQASVDRAHATRGARGYNRARVDDFLSSIDRAQRLRGLSLGKRGDTLTLDRQVDIAVDALAQGVSHTAMISADTLAWDTHVDNDLQSSLHERLFAALARLTDQLVSRPGKRAGTRMIDDTLVVAISEMSRTPRLNRNRPVGKDHWPVTTAMVIGPTGGRVLGGTDPDSGALPVDLSTGLVDSTGQKLVYGSFTAGVLEACGVDPSIHLPQAPLHALAPA